MPDVAFPDFAGYAPVGIKVEDDGFVAIGERLCQLRCAADVGEGRVAVRCAACGVALRGKSVLDAVVGKCER